MRYPTLLLSLLFVSPLGLAQTLEADTVEAFIESLDPVTRYAQGLDDEVTEGVLGADVIPQPGEPLQPYTRSLEYLREEQGEAYEAMGELVEEQGFDSLEEWAATGDRVMVAWLALQMEGNDVGPISPEMLEQVPPQMRPQIERMLAMMEAVRNAPPEDIEAVRPFAARLQDYMSEQGNQEF